MNSLRQLFLLDQDVIFFNHGSFGATPRPVFESYQRWQREMERNPVRFIQRRVNDLLAQARADLGAYLGAAADNLVFVTNATFGMNVVTRSLKLGPGDEVLTTDHEYGAVNNNWQFMAEKLGFKYINHPIPLPVTTQEAFVETFWKGVTPQTRVISMSHITSPTALIFPAQEICRRARQAGIITLIDGAHAPGQLTLRLDEIGADFYIGNLHKWLCAPKGAGFLYARPESQGMLEPLVVSHGWRSTPDHPRTFVDIQQYQGTRDNAAFLAVPDAIRFQKEYHWEQVRADCHALAAEAQQRICEAFDLQPLSPVDHQPLWWSQMLTLPLPPVDLRNLGKQLLDEHKMEIPIHPSRERPSARLSIQAYNTPEEVDIFVDAIKEYARQQGVMA
ncbi:MAG: aminotransferase class V-fold PLP-dependent enzyme [Chloroflexi bacterium]|nr:aminotransferase class V-fold PLP-dependent enzyme [Chloroflexota bacterium]MCL5273735.1 aminotransferase class V-fold PLP-dependent enzyme [Chloroflexota bacterium]